MRDSILISPCKSAAITPSADMQMAVFRFLLTCADYPAKWQTSAPKEADYLNYVHVATLLMLRLSNHAGVMTQAATLPKS
jgi:hypothetical protein